MQEMRTCRLANQPGQRVSVRTTEADRLVTQRILIFFRHVTVTYIEHSINATQLDHSKDEQTEDGPHPVLPMENGRKTLHKRQLGLISASHSQDVLFHFRS